MKKLLILITTLLAIIDLNNSNNKLTWTAINVNSTGK